MFYFFEAVLFLDESALFFAWQIFLIWENPQGGAAIAFNFKCEILFCMDSQIAAL